MSAPPHDSPGYAHGKGWVECLFSHAAGGVMAVLESDQKYCITIQIFIHTRTVDDSDVCRCRICTNHLLTNNGGGVRSTASLPVVA
jgi:hypothetical protein